MSKEMDTGNQPSKIKQTGPLQREWIRGEVTTRGSLTVTPIVRRVSLGLPKWMRPDQGWVIISQRPAALIVQRGDNTQTIPIHDLQQIILFIIMAVTALGLFILMRPKRA